MNNAKPTMTQWAITLYSRKKKKKKKTKRNGNKAYFITHFVFAMAGVMLGDIFYTGMILRSAQQEDRERLRCIWRHSHLWRFGCDNLAMTNCLEMIMLNCRMSEAMGSSTYRRTTEKTVTLWTLHRPWNGSQECKKHGWGKKRWQRIMKKAVCIR